MSSNHKQPVSPSCPPIFSIALAVAVVRVAAPGKATQLARALQQWMQRGGDNNAETRSGQTWQPQLFEAARLAATIARPPTPRCSGDNNDNISSQPYHHERLRDDGDDGYDGDDDDDGAGGGVRVSERDQEWLTYLRYICSTTLEIHDGPAGLDSDCAADGTGAQFPAWDSGPRGALLKALREALEAAGKQLGSGGGCDSGGAEAAITEFAERGCSQILSDCRLDRFDRLHSLSSCILPLFLASAPLRRVLSAAVLRHLEAAAQALTSSEGTPAVYENSHYLVQMLEGVRRHSGDDLAWHQDDGATQRILILAMGPLMSTHPVLALHCVRVLGPPLSCPSTPTLTETPSTDG